MGGMEDPAAFEGGCVWLNENSHFAEHLMDMDKPMGLPSLRPCVNRERVQGPGIWPRMRGEGRCYAEVKKLKKSLWGRRPTRFPEQKYLSHVKMWVLQCK